MKSNFYPIEFDFTEFDVQRVPYEDGLLDRLRQEYNRTHSFFRRGDYIYISPGEEGAATLGRTARLSIQEEPQVASSLIKHIFFRAVKKAKPGLQPEFYPFRFTATKREFDLAADVLHEELRGVLTFKHITEVQFRKNESSAGNLTFGMLVNHRYKWRLNRTCQDLAETGFDLVGREVIGMQSSEHTDGVVAPEISLLGPVQRIDGEVATVLTNEGPADHYLRDLHLHNSRTNITAFLSWHVGDSRADIMMRAIKDREAGKLKPDVVMSQIESLSRWLRQLQYRNQDAFGFRISDQNIVTPPAGFSLGEPSLIFDMSKTRQSFYPSQGLNQHGPYSKSVGFSLNAPKILVVFHRRNASIFAKFLSELRDGIPQHQFFGLGMVNKYRLTSMTYIIEEIGDYSVDAYLAAIERGLQKLDAAFDLAIMETSADFRNLPHADNPYFRVKSFLYMQGTVVQFIKPETAANPTYTIDGIALQIYAKLGGTPWTIPVDQSVDRELVIGIGHTVLRVSQYAGATQTRFVGISTFFAADGKYLTNSRTRHVPFDEYFATLLNNLKDALDRFSSEYSWSSQDRIRLIFHIFKPIKNLEADVVAQLVKEYPQYTIKFAFVTLAERHPYLLYDDSRTSGKGAYVPSRGYAWPLGSRQCLVQLVGNKEMRSVRHGVPTPVLVSIHEKSTFLDIQYVVQQVFKFSRLSFRNFEPIYTPATLLYANLLTRQLSDLRGIPGWNAGTANTQLREKKWFL
jgi:hypothetical protein